MTVKSTFKVCNALFFAVLLALNVTSSSAAETSDSCDKALAYQASLNAIDLFKGAALCANNKRDVDGNVLLVLGQVRSLADMKTLKPTHEKGKKKAAALYKALYYQFGGPGKYQNYQDQAKYDEMVRRIKEWKPIFDKTYTPGWEYEPINSAKYFKALEEVRAHRFKQMSKYQTKYSDAEYMALQQKIDELHKENNNTFKVGTDAYDELSELKKQQNEVIKRLSSQGK